MKATMSEILKVIRDGNRIDRYILRGENGPYITTGEEHLGRFYHKGPVSLCIPVSYDLTEKQELALANDLLVESHRLDIGLLEEDHLAWVNSKFPEVG